MLTHRESVEVMRMYDCLRIGKSSPSSCTGAHRVSSALLAWELGTLI
jgi:hypothetical protein